MAYSRKTRAPSVAMTRGELIGGCLHWPMFLFGMAPLLYYLFGLLNWEQSASRLNLCYFLCNFLVVALVFHRFLIASLCAAFQHFWLFVQAVLLGCALYFALSWAVSFLMALLHLAPANPNNDLVQTLVSHDRIPMLICTVLLVPVVEETLTRGLLFGELCGKNRVLAYVVSTLVFSLLHVFSFFPTLGWGGMLLTAVPYLPAGIALAWTYEKSGVIWAPIVVHCINNAVATGLMAVT